MPLLDSYSFQSFQVDFLKHMVWIEGRRQDLSPREFRVLNRLIHSKHRTLSRQFLLSECWGEDSTPSPRAVDILVARLRAKMGTYSGMIRTVKGFGYHWDEGEV